MGEIPPIMLAPRLTERHPAEDVAPEREPFTQPSHAQPSHYALLFGNSERMATVRDLVERVSDTDVTILIRGESGTGKELVARALHERSLRMDKPFVKVNCAALPTELLESELFGFERGAFTGAFQHKPGKFEFANLGTMFLDEIGDMSLPLQAKMLQVLQDGDFARLGGTHDVHVDVRVITATNRDLETAVTEGQFRQDLYFRLNVVTITLPPLRERREEIPFLTDYFLRKYALQYNKPIMTVSADRAGRFMRYDWPGNVRQLENLIRRMVVLGSGASLLSELPEPSISLTTRVRSSASFAPPAAEPLRRLSLKDISRTAARGAEREMIIATLTRTRWNRKAAAQILGISYKALLYKIRENGLDIAT